MSDGQRRTALYVAGLAAVLAAIGGVVMFANARGSAAEKESQAREAQVKAGPRVRVVAAAPARTERRIELQGEARPFASVTLYAKLSGYLKEIRVDKGDRVQAGQVLAVIESPELDRQYDAAVADAAYKRANAKRAAALATPGVVSAREAELTSSQALMADAQVAALATQKSYETLRAPFTGTVIARFADPGALVQNATNAQTSALPVVTISQGERLRVYVYVDQRDAFYVHKGDGAEVTTPDRPGLPIKGTVTRLASELDPKTRTMLVEIDLDNRDGRIVPGSFVLVALVIATPPSVEVPVEALVLRGKQPFVAVVSAEQRVTYKPVVLVGDDGASARVAKGLAAGERVALNLGENVVDGDLVQPVEPANHAPK
ncbi:MAG TPA: efflux RND transporter periplasmic adaptor subunit [Polyangia bacterium]|nr:efflux RND transporter periplasmic adaptor subunit [Polyangia bacterium]